MRPLRARFFVIALLCVSAPLLSYADTAQQRAALQAQLDQINQQIQENQSRLATQQKQRTSLERDVAILDSKIEQAQLQIKQRNLTIAQLKSGIADKQAGIDTLDSQVAAGQASLAQILRRTREIDDLSFAQIALQGSFSDLFDDISAFEQIQQALGQAFTTFAAQRSDLTARKSALQDQQQEEQDLLQIQVLQQNVLKDTEQQKQNLVVAARGQESVYQQLIASQQQTAAQIRSQLFTLNNANHSASFGDMYGYAKEAGALTGVPPAFILAILTTESNLGQNTGRCSYQGAMSPTRDIPVYLQIMNELGLDPNSQKVSCAQKYGAYGGAMGPAQFIPSTWQLYKARIAKATGQNPPNPWDPRTATFATAIYMNDLGADAGTTAALRRAALRYLAGSRWQNPAYAFYWDSVQNYMTRYEQNIAVLNGS